MAILFSADELREQEEAVYAQYLIVDSSSRALKEISPHVSARQALAAETLRAAALSLQMLRTNAHWIEQGLEARMKANRT